MAFTEASVKAQLDSAGTGKIINMQTYIPGASLTQIYAVGVTAPYAGRARWVAVDSSRTAAQAAGDIQTALQA